MEGGEIDCEFIYLWMKTLIKSKDNMRVFWFVILFTLAISVQGQVSNFEFNDKEKVAIRLIEPTRFIAPIDFQFIKTNISGRLILPNLDTSVADYRFDIENIRTIKKNKEFELSIGYGIYPKDRKKLGYYGVGIYKLTIKKRNNRYIVEKLKLLNYEI